VSLQLERRNQSVCLSKSNCCASLAALGKMTKKTV